MVKSWINNTLDYTAKVNSLQANLTAIVGINKAYI